MPGPTSVDPPLPAVTVPQLAYLAAVADAPTFAAAAASVGVTTSALSQGLSELERRIGVVLFERVGRRQVLREEAGEVVAYARRVVADTGDLARWAASVRTGRSGRLRVGMIDAVAVHHRAPALRAFRRAHAHLDLRLMVAPSGELLAQLGAGLLDLAVVVEPAVRDSALDLDPLLDEPLVVVSAEGTPGRRSSTTRERGDRGCSSRAARTRVASSSRPCGTGALRSPWWPRSHQPEVLREMARLGVGWTVLPEVQATPPGRRGRAGRELPVLTTRRLVVARRVGRVTNPAADALVASLAERAAPLPSPG